MRYKLFTVVAYKLENGETVMTTRQMAVAVHKSPKTASEFMRNMGITPLQVLLPNRIVTDMIPVEIALAFWKSLNESDKGNVLTKLGQIYLENYLTDS